MTNTTHMRLRSQRAPNFATGGTDATEWSARAYSKSTCALLAFLAAGCGGAGDIDLRGERVTAVRVTTVFDEAWQLTELELSSDDFVSRVPEEPALLSSCLASSGT